MSWVANALWRPGWSFAPVCTSVAAERKQIKMFRTLFLCIEK